MAGSDVSAGGASGSSDEAEPMGSGPTRRHVAAQPHGSGAEAATSPPGLREIGPAELVEVAEGCLAYIQPDGTWFINNTGAVVDGGEVLLVDTCATERRTRSMLAAVGGRTGGAPVGTLVNTHVHGDHTNGNSVVVDAFGDVKMLGHPDTRAGIEAVGILHFDGVWDPVDWGDLRPVAPSVLVDDRTTLTVGGLSVEVIAHPGPAHTTSDLVVWVAERSVLYTGDLVFHRGTPFVLMGSISGTLASIDWLRGFGPDVTLVPGHGPVTDVHVLDVIEDYVRFVQDVAVTGRRDGLSPLEAAQAADLGRFAALSDAERLVGNLHRAYAELGGAEPGAPIDMIAAIGDMLTFNGGRPLRCVA
jgi:cyclase